MYICSCNAITDSQIRAAAKDTGCSPTKCYLCLGFRPQCGKCIPRVKEILAETRAAVALEQADFTDRPTLPCEFADEPEQRPARAAAAPETAFRPQPVKLDAAE